MAQLEPARSSAARKPAPTAARSIDGARCSVPMGTVVRHELKFRSANVNGFTLDVTYHLTVA